MTEPAQDQDPGLTVLAAVIPDRADLLETASRKLRAAHFTGQVLPELFALLQRYLDLTGEVLTRQALAGALDSRRVQAGTLQLFLETYDLCVATQASDGQFVWAVGRLRDIASTQATGQALAEGYEILMHGTEGKDGRVVGPEAARLHVLSEFSRLDSELNESEAPEGDVNAEENQILDRYNKTEYARKLAGGNPGISFGVPAIDDRLGGGLNRGELMLVGGFSSSGKTSVCVQAAWNAKVVQHKNVVLFTSETLRPQVINKVIARHSRAVKFEIELPDGLDSSRIRAATLSGPEIAQFQAVVHDFTSNPEYGRFYLAQLPFGATIGQVRSRLARIGHLFSVDLCIIDYLQLLNSDRKRDTSHEESAQMVKDAKAIAATFDNGLGVPVISPWQVNRSGRDRALKEGGYSGIDLAGTAEAFNAQPLDSKVRMADGLWKTIGEIQAGDRLIDPEGQDSKVLGVYPKGTRPVYRVKLSDGSAAEACDQHLWVVEDFRGPVRRRTVTTLELQELAGKLRGARLPAVLPMEFDGTSVLPVDPYLLGVLLSEGSLGDCLESQVSFTQDCVNTDMLERVRAALPPVHSMRSREKTGKHIISGDGTRRPGSNQVLMALRQLDLAGKRSWEKFIPPVYLRASAEERLALLQGIMDGDGCIQRRKSGSLNISFPSASERLRDDVVALVQTLGGRCRTLTCRRTRYTSPAQRTPKAARDSYRITSMGIPLNPFYMQRKAALFVPSSTARARKVVAVEYVREAEVACIRVSADSQMYVTDGNMPTHNTPDVVMTLLEPGKIENARACPIKGEMLKIRDGSRAGADFKLKADYATSWFRSEEDADRDSGGVFNNSGSIDFGSLA